MSKQQAKLGDKVKDTVSGFTGIVTGTSVFLNGCTRMCVQPPVGKDGKLPDAAWFDAPQLEVLKEGAAKIGSRETGGPMPSIPTRNIGR